MAEKKHYRAVVDLFYPTDVAILRRLIAGEDMPLRVRGMKMVNAGDIVDDIPEVSVAGLLAAGRIEEVLDGAP